MIYIKFKTKYINLASTHEMKKHNKYIGFYQGENYCSIEFESKEECKRAIEKIESIIKDKGLLIDIQENIDDSIAGGLSISKEDKDE